ncbi:MAG: hypothetical protein CMO80_03440 [Verrucomicrobiales bacterium]|nr:hypothetical protein [Verrucomicrobiales bacterium]|tara:strand:+ start:4848 stop:5501 length:654 start_codon:yes stop_codon:yes gene_type:complete
MASDFDSTEFVDTDVHTATLPRRDPPAEEAAPSTEDLAARSAQVQSNLDELRRREEQLREERDRIEEQRRQRAELETSFGEMLHNLTRGVAIMTEDEEHTRCEAKQMAKTLGRLQEALKKVEAINVKDLRGENWTVELTRGLTAMENARHEWNGALEKWPRLHGIKEEVHPAPDGSMPPPKLALTEQTFGQLCRLGFALTWPIALAILAVLVVMLFR